jgi:hypothetical protein
MATLHTFGRPSGLPLSLLSQAIHRLTRAELEDLAQSLIDHMDAIDGDPDLEDDDPAGQCDEDGVNTGDGLLWAHGKLLSGPGCMISDDDSSARLVIPEYGEDQTAPALNSGSF